MIQHLKTVVTMLDKDPIPGIQSTPVDDLSGLRAIILDRVSSLRNGLKTIGSRSEKDFMALGNFLMEGSTTGKAIESKAFSIVSMTEGAEEKKALASMKDLIDGSLSRFRENGDNIRQQFEAVKSVLQFLDELQAKNGDIERLARYLRAVALNIFIETSRSIFVSDNFSIIAKEIKQLSENIVDLSKNVNATVDDSKKRFSGLLAGIMDGVAELGQVSIVADSAVKQAVDITDSWMDSAEKTAENAVDMGKNLAKHVENIVIALQFHDSMRQRLEHMVTGLSDLSSLLGGGSGHLLGMEKGSDRENLAMAHAVVSLLNNHVHHMTVEIDEVAAQVSTAFNTLGSGIETVAAQVINLTGHDTQGTGHQGRDAGRHLLSSIQSLGSLRLRGVQLLERMNDIYDSAMTTTSLLTELTGKIHDISMDAHVKGINAIIAASHLGEEGRTLAVLAGEMKRLADMAELFVKDVEAIIQKVASAMDHRTSGDESGLEQEKILDDALSAIVGMVDRMKIQTGDLQNTMESMDTVHQKVKIQLEIIPALSRDLKEQSASISDLEKLLSPYSDSHANDKLMGSAMFSRYTMEKERQIHRTSAGSGFHSATANPVKGHETQNEPGEFGDNVDLF